MQNQPSDRRDRRPATSSTCYADNSRWNTPAWWRYWVAKTRAAISPEPKSKPPIDFAAGRADAILRALDKDGDGVISSTEASAETNPGVRALLARADANRDGVITRAELLAALRSE